MNNAIRDELKSLADKQDRITPRMVLDFARANPSSAIYGWLDTKSAFDPEVAVEKYGLLLCRLLITKVKVRVEGGESGYHTVRQYASTLEDRAQGGGYRSLDNLISHEEGRQQLIRTALTELRTLQKRYAVLTELVSVWRAIDMADKSKAS